MSENNGDYYVAGYFLGYFSSGLDRNAYASTEPGAITLARQWVRDARNGAAHALVSYQGGVLATVIRSKGRVLTKKAKRR